MDSFPDSLLLEIFDFLNYEDLCLGVRLTCVRWWRLTHDATFWRHVQIADHFTDARFLQLLSQPWVHDNVEGLDCSKCENLTAESFSRLADLPLARLRTLSIPLISAFPPAIYLRLSTACPGLEELENVGAKPDEAVQPLRIQLLFKQLRAVHDRPLSSYGRIRRAARDGGRERRERWLDDLAEVALHCPEVEAYRCRRGLEYVNDEGLEKVSVLFPRMRKLELGYCSISDEGLRLFFLNNEVGLEELILDKPGEITDEGLKLIADHCPKIEKLKVSRSLGLTNEGVTYLVSKCHLLTELHLNNRVYTQEDAYVKSCDFSDACVQSIAAECPDMVYLRLFYSAVLSRAGITSVMRNCQLLQGLMLYECPQIDDHCLAEIAEIKYLRALVLVGCNSVTPAGIVDLILLAPSLLRLTLFSNLLTPLFFGDMSELCQTTYAKISAEDCSYLPSCVKKITMKGVGGPFLQLVTVLCPDLHTLDIRDACIVNEVALRSVMRNCEQLRVLDVQSLDCLNDAFLAALVEFSPLLRKLGLGRAVSRVSNTALAELLCAHPSLTVVSMDTKGTDIDEELLIDVTRAHHGGHCFLHVDYECRQPDNYLEENHRLVDLHFTPLKYLSSVPPGGGP